MGFFNQVKDLAKQASSSNSLADTYAGEMSTTIAQSLSEIVAKAQDHLNNDSQYINYIATPLFKMLPLPAQLIGRERLKWDPIMLDIRNELGLTSSNPQLNTEASKKILEIVKKHHTKQ